MGNVNDNINRFIWPNQGPTTGGGGRVGDGPAPTPSGNLNAPSDAEVNRAISDMVSALRVGGMTGMNAPYAVSQSFVNNAALQQTILSIAAQDRTDDMTKFLEVMSAATLVHENLVRNKDALIAQYGWDVTAAVAENDNTTLMKELAYVSIDMYADMSEMVTSFIADLAMQQLKNNDKIVQEMKDAADARYAAAMITACFQIGSGAMSGAMGIKAGSEQLKATQIESGMGAANRTPAQAILDKGVAGTHSASATKYEAGSRATSQMGAGLGEAISAGFTQKAAKHDATVKELEAVGQMLGQMQQLAQSLQGWLTQQMQSTASANQTNIQSSLETQKKIMS